MTTRLLVINGREMTFTAGQTILEAAQANQIRIPTLCHLKDSTPTGACRICVVEVQGARTLLAACSTPAGAGMIIRTDSPKVIAARKMILELMLSSGNHNCATANADARAKFEKAWNVKDLPDKNGLMMPRMLEGLADGSIRGFYIFGENLANTEPNIRKVEHELASAEFIVCNDIFPTETTRFAHVILPAPAWSENDGTFTNSERRVNRVRTASSPPGGARPNWWIFKQLALRMGHQWSSNSAREIWDDEISALAPQLCGIKYGRLEGDGLQWPCPSEDHPGTCFLHKDGQFTCGLGVFNPVDWTPPAEVPDADYPFVLSTGRRLAHCHTRTQIGRCEGLNDILGEETADISPEDARALGISDGEMIQLTSRRGMVRVKAKVTPQVPPGLVWMAFHFRENNANWLTIDAFDNISMTAEYKACAVRIDKTQDR